MQSEFPNGLPLWKWHIMCYYPKMHNIRFSFFFNHPSKEGAWHKHWNAQFFHTRQKTKTISTHDSKYRETSKMDNDPYTYSITYSRNNSESGWITMFPIRWQEKKENKKIPRPNAFAETTKARATRIIKSKISRIFSTIEVCFDFLMLILTNIFQL